MKQLLKELINEKAPGPSPSFSVVHLVKALDLIAKSPIGRTRLAKELFLGEGATRTLINRLKDNNLITVDRFGCFFSMKGKKLWNSLHEVLPRKMSLERSGLTLATFNTALLVKGFSNKVRGGMEQRDAALLVGAKGATTLTFKKGKLIFPVDDRDVSVDFPQVHRQIVDSLNPEENDVIVIGSADTLEKAEYGALAAALSLFNDIDINK
ncbi:MAG: DUF4443 domain-containing protein [Candidatus Bathyarchaeota archaeon]|nr:MAG: DUF4443 domain-containing protein [Candidatus Bathyarchaeota archaeon]